MLEVYGDLVIKLVRREIKKIGKQSSGERKRMRGNNKERETKFIKIEKMRELKILWYFFFAT